MVYGRKVLCYGKYRGAWNWGRFFLVALTHSSFRLVCIASYSESY